jgi:hypothetical protein
VRYWRKQKEILKNDKKSDSRAFRGPKAGKSAYFTHSEFSAAKLEKKSAHIRRIYTVMGCGKYAVFMLHNERTDTRCIQNIPD